MKIFSIAKPRRIALLAILACTILFAVATTTFWRSPISAQTSAETVQPLDASEALPPEATQATATPLPTTELTSLSAPIATPAHHASDITEVVIPEAIKSTFSPPPTQSQPSSSSPSPATARQPMQNTQPAPSTSFASALPTQDILVPVGLPLPAALVDEALNATPAQVAALDAISEKFLDAIAPNTTLAPTTQVPSAPATKPSATWNKAQNEADANYYAIFGQEAYVAQGIKASKEALNDR